MYRATNPPEERARIKAFWLSLSESERRDLVQVEKDAVLRKMKEQQKHSCGCAVCGRKRYVLFRIYLFSLSLSLSGYSSVMLIRHSPSVDPCAITRVYSFDFHFWGPLRIIVQIPHPNSLIHFTKHISSLIHPLHIRSDSHTHTPDTQSKKNSRSSTKPTTKNSSPTLPTNANTRLLAARKAGCHHLHLVHSLVLSK
jgi:hypothetical protein